MWQMFNFSLINFVLFFLYILGDFLNLIFYNIQSAFFLF